MNIEIGSVVTLDDNNEYFVIGDYNIDGKNYFIGRNEKNIGQLILFENMGEQIRIIKSKDEIDKVIKNIAKIK